VSVGVATVVLMSIGRHVCIWFEDGDGIDVLCVCGARAVTVVDEESGELVVVALEEDPVPLAVSA
jgi:hypothetical protein